MVKALMAISAIAIIAIPYAISEGCYAMHTIWKEMTR